MSSNINQIFTANPITSNADTDLIYIGQSPYGSSDDAAINYASFKLQFVQSAGSLSQGAIPFGDASNKATSDVNNLYWDNSAQYLYIGSVANPGSVFIRGTAALLSVGDANFAQYLTAGVDPVIKFDTVDYIQYFRSLDWLTVNINSKLPVIMDGNSNVVITNSALATTATDGFLYLPGCPGLPTGVPTTFTGTHSLVFDSTNNKLMAYNSGWTDVIGNGSTSITTLGTITTGTWNGNVITETYGGTGQSSYALGDILYSSAPDTLSKLSGNTTTTKKILTQTGTGAVSAAPVWDDLSGSDITGAALVKADDTNVTLTLSGNPTDCLLRTTTITAGWSGQLAVGRGGTGTSNQFTTGSVVFAGASGVYQEDNANFYWDDSANSLSLGTTNNTTRLNVDGVISIFDSAGKLLNAGLATESSGTLINIGVNDGSDNRFGGSYNSGNQGGFLRVDGRAGARLFNFYGRTAGVAGTASELAFLDSSGNFSLGTGALSTTATDGYIYMPTAAGTPTGTPTSIGGRSPFIFDSTNNKLKIYNGGWIDPVGNDLLTWVPVLGDGTSNFTLSTALGQYVRIGNVVHIWCLVSWSSKGSATGQIRLSMPITSSTSVSRVGFTPAYMSGVISTTQVTLTMSAGQAAIYMFKCNSGAAPSALLGADFSATGELQISGTYFV